MGGKTFKEWQYFKLSITSFDEDIDNVHVIDQMTWRQWLNNALKRSYGIFGEGVEYSFLHVEDKLAYIRVNHADKDTFSSSISTYISTDELVGSPLTVTILQECSSLNLLDITDHDRIWLKRAVSEEEEEYCKCT
ncbi:hypothetical protein SMKI_02G0950 [Saccharomyces mikatae IFO 1815]|uniref:Ribonucleases P/MRP subunit Pop8-like domain-containing protein n=1 Tax=Saccharomyces mikatae IFO 1815 TaxID=226126 RepID=A0AA35IW18_SACMI|nr:uncharacterized protein SMKI_02G0950 [Saccharomyces mikatae IFO 1815]CAI4037227.1 hypothetical protein SMKI_02G0950 [Saccharomyces mikatae IFO 1815]